MHYECSYIYTGFDFHVIKGLAEQERCYEEERIKKYFKDFK